MKTFFQSCTKTDAFMMRISSVSIVFMTLGVYLYRILVDLDLRKYVWIIQSIAFVAQTAVMIFWITISVTGDISMPFSELVFWVIVACGELMAITKLYKMRFAWNKIVLNPIIRTTILVLAEFLVVQLLQKHLDAWLVCILALGVGIGCYELSKKLPFLKKGTKME